MRVQERIFALLIPMLLICGPACETQLQDGLTEAELPAPDGIDPKNPNIERSTNVVDFTDVNTIRVELPTARVSVSQAGGSSNASIQVTEIIVKEGYANDTLEQLLTRSEVTAERSFVDESRLDVEATVAQGLANEDIVFDVRLVVPSGANIEILVGNGPVQVTDITGNLEIGTKNGSIDIDGVRGNVIAETTNRSITIADATGNVSATTTQADIDLRLTPGANGRVFAESDSGNVRLAIDNTTGAMLELNSLQGTVTANLSGFTVSDVSTGNGFLSGMLNGGGGQIEGRTISGEIDFVGIGN